MKLFISYARVDKPLCKQIVDRLSGVHEIWYDQRLHAGQAWWDEIVRHLEWCDGFVYLLSPESIESEYCQKEFEIAHNSAKHLFPVVIRKAKGGKITIPAGLDHIHYADLSEGMDELYILSDALTIAERTLYQPRMSAPTLKEVDVDKPGNNLSPSAAIGQAADAMDAADFDRAVFLLKQAQEANPRGRMARMIANMLEKAENALEAQSEEREAKHEYLSIMELVNRVNTRELGCQEFVDFRNSFPDYDPNGLIIQCEEIVLELQAFMDRRDMDAPINPRAWYTLGVAAEIARELHHSYVGNEHLLISFLRAEGGIAGRVLRDLGIDQNRVRSLVEHLTQANFQSSALVPSPALKRVLEMAVIEAHQMSHNSTGTEHFLLSITHQSQGVAIDVLKRLGVSREQVRLHTFKVLKEVG